MSNSSSMSSNTRHSLAPLAAAWASEHLPQSLVEHATLGLLSVAGALSQLPSQAHPEALTKSAQNPAATANEFIVVCIGLRSSVGIGGRSTDMPPMVPRPSQG